MNLQIFYSWQETTQTKYNKNFILSCIEKAVKKINNKPELKNVKFKVLEGIRGESGSPSVASKITDERIPNCDIFIADLSVVNSINRFQKIARFLLGDKFKPFQNNNVINEHGVATHAIGLSRMIGVLNNEFGSPNENPENIPFDLRHTRFPIEYNYSSQTKEKDREQIQANLISDLAGAIRDAAITALQTRKNKYMPFSVWSDWEKNILLKERFIRNQKIEELWSIILASTKNTKESIRILGLSGLGKTRILLEIFRPNTEDEDSILLSSRILYINCNAHSNVDYTSIFLKLKNSQDDHIVILDNCPIHVHRQVLSFIKKDDNRLSVISLDSNPEEFEQDKITDVNYVSIKKEDLSDIVDQILVRDFGNLEKEKIEKIKEFSQGIPLMAVLLGESVKNGEQFIGKLDDKELLNKLLGQKGQDQKSRTILKSCSIFNYFGFYDELASQVEFIAKNKNITSLNGDDQVLVNDFNEVCQSLLKREIFEKKGRFIGMRPFPLAISLAQEWLEPCTSKRLFAVIADIASLPDPDRKSLSDALSEQMKYLGYNDKALLIVENLVGPSSPFDDAEVLNTELGSRLFRAFVEVNPVAVAKNFTRVFSSRTIEELLLVVEGRRNIIWTLEKLCFDKRTFSDSVKILYSFAVAENETWANNATGQFLQLFNIILSGTEATLSERWKIIEWGLSDKDDQYYLLAIKAMKAGLNYGHFSRGGGAENQGGRKLIDNYPTMDEVTEYWNNILIELTQIIKSENKYSNIASEAVATSIRSIIRGRLVKVLLPHLLEITTFKKNDWDEGLSSLKLAKKYDKSWMTELELNQINDLVKTLTKTDFIARYSALSKSYYLDGDEIFSSDKMVEAITRLADEFILSKASWADSFPTFFRREQVFSYHFGKRIYQLIKDDLHSVNKFIELSLNTIITLKKEERDVQVLGGFITESIDEIKGRFYNQLTNSEELNYLLFYFLSIDSNGKKYFDLLFALVDSDRSPLSEFRKIGYGSSLSNLSLDELSGFGQHLFKYGNEGYEIVFELFFRLGYNDEGLKERLTPIVKECVHHLGFIGNKRNYFDHYQWFHAITEILNKTIDNDFAQLVNNSLIDSITWENSYHLDGDAQRLYQVLLKKYFDQIWPRLSEALLSIEQNYITFYGLKHILGAHIGGVTGSSAILLNGDVEKIFQWCHDNKPLAPIRLAELAPIFDNDNTNYSKWHPVALRLIDEFGEYKKVLGALNANMGTFSWMGSIIPLLEGKKELFRQIADHKKEEVRTWAISYLSYLDKDIEREKNRDEEAFLM